MLVYISQRQKDYLDKFGNVLFVWCTTQYTIEFNKKTQIYSVSRVESNGKKTFCFITQEPCVYD